jgi:hypothetical protein
MLTSNYMSSRVERAPSQEVGKKISLRGSSVSQMKVSTQGSTKYVTLKNFTARDEETGNYSVNKFTLGNSSRAVS